MKFKLTPFFIASLGLLLYGLYWWFIADSGEEGWGLLFGMVITAFSVGLFVVYIIFRAIFKTRVWTQTSIETLLLCVGLFYYYKTEGAFVFTLPSNYKGHVLVVYNVEGQPTLPTNFLSNKVKVNVPTSGIVLTSSFPLNVQYYKGGIFTEDGKNIKDLHGSKRRYDIPVQSDTIICNGRKYRIDKWMVKDQPNWTLKDDTLYKLNEKLELACDLINRKATANKSVLPKQGFITKFKI